MFNANQKDLSNLLSRMSYALENKDDLEAYTHLAIRIANGAVRFTASNRMMVAEATLPAEVDPKLTLSIGVPGLLACKLIKSLPEARVHFSMRGARLLIECKTTNAHLPVLPEDRFHDFFPDKTDYDSSKLEEEYKSLAALHLFMTPIRGVSHCIDEKTSNRAFAAVCIDPFFFVATDGRRLAVNKNISIMVPEGEQIRIPAWVVPRLSKVYPNERLEASYLLKNGRFHLRSDGIAVCFGLKSDVFPNYLSVLPSFKRIAELSREFAVDALKRIKILSPDSVSVVLSQGSLHFTASTAHGDIHERIRGMYDGTLNFKMNTTYLLDALLSSDDNMVELGVGYRGTATDATTVMIRLGGTLNAIKTMRID